MFVEGTGTTENSLTGWRQGCWEQEVGSGQSCLCLSRNNYRAISRIHLLQGHHVINRENCPPQKKLTPQRVKIEKIQRRMIKDAKKACKGVRKCQAK